MVRIIRIETEEDNHLQLRRLVFPLKVSRNVWLTDNKLVLEYPLKFNKLKNIGEAVVFSLLPIAYREDSNINLPVNLPIEKGTQDRINRICSLWNSWFSCNRRTTVFADTIDTSIPNPKERSGVQLFSGGVDSFTTLKRQRDRIRYLVLYKGADIPVTRPERFREVKNYMERFAQEQNTE